MHRTTQIFSRIFSACLLGLLWTAAAFAQPGTVHHQVREGDSIRALLLRHNCLSSMLEYAQAREAFARLNPGIQYSRQLSPGSTVSVPAIKTGTAGCLAFENVQIVRVEFESTFSAERVLIHLDGPALPDLFSIDKIPPPRVVCDFDGATMRPGLSREVDCRGRMIHKIRIGQEDKPYPRVRVVLEMDKNLAGKVEQEFFERESLFMLTVFESGR